MSNRVLIFLLRAVLGVAGAYFLTSFFLTPKGMTVNWVVVGVLAVVVVLAAYASELWRRRKN